MSKRHMIIVSASAVLLTGVSVTNMRSPLVYADTTDAPQILLEKKRNLNLPGQNPLLDGKEVSNGYSDGGFTYLKPDDTSSERVSSYHLDTTEGWSNDLQTIIFDTEKMNGIFIIFILKK